MNLNRSKLAVFGFLRKAGWTLEICGLSVEFICQKRLKNATCLLPYRVLSSFDYGHNKRRRIFVSSTTPLTMCSWRSRWRQWRLASSDPGASAVYPMKDITYDTTHSTCPSFLYVSDIPRIIVTYS